MRIGRVPTKPRTRRQVLSCGGGLLAWLSTGKAAFGLASDGKSGASKTPATGAQGSGQIATETDASRHLTVPVSIDGRGPFHFVVDTGADRTILAFDIAESLGLARTKEVIVQGIISALPARTATIRRLSIGPVACGNIDVPLLPRALLGADGYLGLDVVNGRRVILDFANHVLEITGSRPEMFTWERPHNQARVSVYGPSGHLRSVDCRAGNVSTTAFIDTGAEITVGNPKLYDALLADSQMYAAKGKIPITGVTGGEITASVVALDSIKLHSLTFTNCDIAIADLPVFDVWGLANRPTLLIGMNWLRDFARVSIDYGNKELRFDLADLSIASRV